jgi:hypothetical protein
MGALVQTGLVILAGAVATRFLFKKFFTKPKKKANACAADCKCH